MAGLENAEWYRDRIPNGEKNAGIEAMFVQIVKFRLRPETSRDTSLHLTQQMIAWLENRTGFLTYELYEGAEDWSDRIAWEDETCAQAGLKAFLATAIAKEMVPLVEEGYSSFSGEAVASATAKG